MIPALSKLDQKKDLSYGDMCSIMSEMLSGNLADSVNAEFLSKLAEKGETDDELLGMLDKMLEFSVRVESENDDTIDMCGTGGDGLCTFNVSTTASFVVAAAGGRVAKHGNRSSSRGTGSADIFEYLGYDLNKGPSDVLKVLHCHGIAFMFAQRYHPAMRYAAPARKMLSKRTAFNLLGPLSNPAGVKNQLVGVSSAEFLQRVPRILGQRGAKTIMAVCSNMDEFSTSATNRVCLLQDGKIQTYNIEPESVGLHRSELSEIQVESREDAVASFVRVISGTANRAMIETTALNAAGGLVVGGIAQSIAQGVELALEAIEGGGAFGLLERFVADTGDAAKLEVI